MLTGFGPAMARAHGVDVARGAFGALLGLGFAALVGAATGAPVWLIAPFGASSVLLYAVPNSPLAQPWSVFWGNVLSALAALVVVDLLPPGVWVAPVAVAAGIALMLVARALHPPGGAVALLVALSPHPDWHFALLPVASGTAALIVAALVWNRLVGRVYPFRTPAAPGPHGTRDPAPPQRVGVDPAQMAGILDAYRQSANLGVADLARLVGAVEDAAAARKLEGFTAADIMSRDLVTVGPEARFDTVAEVFRTRGFHSLPVVAGDSLQGVIFQIDLIRAPGVDAQGLMRRGLPQATPDTPVGVLLPMLEDGGAEAVPIMDGTAIVGIVTRTDLISALARRLARLSPA
jgi:CBS domain-containing membrane protein